MAFFIKKIQILFLISLISQGYAFAYSASKKVCYKSFYKNKFIKLCFKITPISGIKDSGEYIYLNPFEEKNFPSFANPKQYVPPKNILDLEAIDTERKISTYFKISKLMSRKKGRFGFFSPKALKFLNRMRKRTNENFTVTSGFRSPSHNKKVGGALWSRHKYGDAVDLYPKNISIKASSREKSLNFEFSISFLCAPIFLVTFNSMSNP